VTAAVAPARLAPLTPADPPFDRFLAEQAGYADNHIDAAHHTVARLRTLVAEQALATRSRLRGVKAG
jgi:hypothetical protein